MLIGGSPGSTAGGVKTTTLAVLILGAWSVVRQKKSVHVFKRRIEGDLMKKACAIVVIYMIVAISSVVFLSAYEQTALDVAMVEVFSAVGTVGLSMGLTPSVGVPTRLLLSWLMFFGRIGGLSMVLALTRQTTKVSVEMPIEKISV
jgi:trk system potassium uptake protein TrkH